MSEFMAKAKPFAVAAALLGAGVAVWYAWRGLERAMFSENPRFAITSVVVNTGLAVKPDAVKSAMRITEGANIFSFDAARTRRDFLRTYPNVADVKIRKILPSAVEITAEDRKPVLRVWQSANAVDKDGLVMISDEFMRQRWWTVPVLLNGKNQIRTEPGGSIAGDAKMRRALDIVNAHNAMADRMSFKIAEIDIASDVYAVVKTTETGSPRLIKIPWDDMGAEADVREALTMASDVIARPDAANLARFDIILKSTTTPRVYGRTTWD